MSAVPRAVRKQIAEAERLAEEAKKRQDQPMQQLELPLEPPAAPSAPGEPEPTPVSAPAPEPPAASDAAEQRYRTLQGKYDAETARMRAQIDAMARDNEQLRQLLQTLSQQQQAAPPPQEPAPASAPPIQSLTPEEIEDYGPDMINMIKRVVAGETQQLRSENDALKQQLNAFGQQVTGMGHTVAKSARGQFLEAMDVGMPNWRTLNSDRGFLDWLQGIDLYSGRPRGEMLDDASKANDASRALAFFRGYEREQTAASPPAQPPAAVRGPMDTLVAPRSTASAPAGGAQNTGQVWTRAEVAAFYNDVRKGIFEGREADRKKIETEIFAAMAEGRLQ